MAIASPVSTTTIARSVLDTLNTTLTTAAAEATQQNGIYYRVPWVFTCDMWLNGQSTGGTKYVVCSVNPSSISFTFEQRASEQEVRDGQILMYWRNRRGGAKGSSDNTGGGSFFKPFTVSMQLQSGSILPVYKDQSSTKNIPPGIVTFYDFIALIDTPKLYMKNGVPTTNNQYLITNGLIFPKLTLCGYFVPNEILRFEENVESTGQISNWSATFRAISSAPEIRADQVEQLKAAWVSANSAPNP